MLRGGHQAADIAVLYPTESVWTKFVPSRNWTREAAAAARVESAYRAAADSLFTAPRDFTFVDGRALAEAKVEAGTLVHGKLRWRAVVLPGADTLPLAAWENLARFVRGGGVVIALGALPQNSDREFPSAKVQVLARELFGENLSAADEPRSRSGASGGAGIYLPRGLESLLPLVLNGVLEPDVKIAGGKSPVRVNHRRLEGHEVYFAINDSARAWSGEVTFAATGEGERWNPATGRKEEAVQSTSRLSLEPYGAAFFRFTSARLPQKRAVAGAAFPNLTLRPVTPAVPSTPHGEFVRAELTPDPTRSTPTAPAWQARAVLTKTQVDTHLFAQFHYEPPLDLGHADCVAIDTWVPEGQKTPESVLVILHEAGGGDFIADTGRSLAAPGRERSFIPITRFQLAGWSKDADGVLDLQRVSDIRVGWGGYFGTEGETVQFSVALPQTNERATASAAER
jgi:hypothetical protein